MTYDKQIASAEGNGKSVYIYQIQSIGLRRDRSGEYLLPKVLGYACEVYYVDRPELGFSESKSTKADAMRFFNCWKKLTEIEK